MSCFKCDLSFNRINELTGIGNKDAKIAILSDYPRHYESKKNVSFSNKKYKALFNALSEIGVNTNNAYFTYLVKCPINKLDMDFHKDVELKTRLCSKHNLEFNNMPNIKLIILLGSFATNYIYNNFNEFVPSMDKLVNTHIEYGKLVFTVLYHPFHTDSNDKKINNYDILLTLIQHYVNPFHTIKI